MNDFEAKAYRLGVQDGREAILGKWESRTLPQTSVEAQEMRDEWKI